MDLKSKVNKKCLYINNNQIRDSVAFVYVRHFSMSACMSGGTGAEKNISLPVAG